VLQATGEDRKKLLAQGEEALANTDKGKRLSDFRRRQPGFTNGRRGAKESGSKDEGLGNE
jgi:hypothetical protein